MSDHQFSFHNFSPRYENYSPNPIVAELQIILLECFEISGLLDGWDLPSYSFITLEFAVADNAR